MTDIRRKTVEDLKRQDTRALEKLGRRAIQKKLNTLETLTITYVDPKKLFPNGYNPNRQDEEEFDLLLKSMTEDGFTTPILVHEKTNEIIDGEHRWRAATRLGLSEIPVVYTTMTPQQMRVATLRHNRARGSEDIELTIAILKDLRTLGSLEQAIDSLGLDDEEINNLIEDLPAPEVQAAQEHSKAWVVAPSEAKEQVIPGKRELISFSDTLKQASELMEKKLEAVPEEDEVGRHRILVTDQPWHSTIFQIKTSDLPLVEKVLGSENIAQSLLRLCMYHRIKIGALTFEEQHVLTLP